MKKILAAALAACLTFTVAEPVIAEAQDLSYAQIYQPTIKAEVTGAGPVMKKFDIEVDDQANGQTIKKIEITKANSPIVLEDLKALYEKPKFTGYLALKPQRIYPDKFTIALECKVTYTDDSSEQIMGSLVVHPVAGLVKLAPTPVPTPPPEKQGNALSSADGQPTELGRTLAIVGGVIASIAVLIGIGSLFMNAMAPLPPARR